MGEFDAVFPGLPSFKYEGCTEALTVDQEKAAFRRVAKARTKTATQPLLQLRLLVLLT